jgi:uncharacterized membrane protein
MKKTIILILIGFLFTQCVYDNYVPVDPNADTSGNDTTNTGGGDSTDNSGGGTSGNNDTSNKTTYLADVKPILNQLCVTCHGSVNPEDGFDISTYIKAKDKINKIIGKMDLQNGDEDIMPPSGRADENAIATIKKWKTDGLLEGTDTGGSGNTGNSSGNITYTTDIQAVLTQECTACHGANNPSAGLNLTTYTNTKNNIDLIIGRIDLQNGQTGIMPPAGRMTDAKIQLFKDWKTQGLLEQ